MALRIFSRWCRRLAWVFLLCVPGIAAFTRAAEPEELSDEEARQVQIAERFLDILMNNPRRGTALDRVYGHHVEFGTLDAFLEKLDQRLQDNPQDGAGWMLLGLIQSQRGADVQAAEALEQAETHRPNDPLASHYLAQSLLRIGESEAAVAAFQRALARNPARADLLEISQQLGRVHQRAQRIEQALAVWQRLESQFPDDPRVLEQIAITLAEEGALAEALARYQRLADLVRDDYRRVMFKIQAAELTIRLFGLRLDANTQLALAEQMRRLGLHAMAEAVAARIQRQAGSQPSILASLMMLYQGQGKTDEAKQLAHVLLRRTVPPVSAMATSARNPFRYSSTENHVRTQALQVLQQTGELPVLIRQLEEQRSRSPDAPRLYEQLIEYYTAANQREKVGELLEQAVARRPDAPAFRYQLAQHLERTGKGAEACDHYLELLRQKPQWLADNLYSIRQLFQRAERTVDLVEAIRKIDVKGLRQPYYIVEIAGTLLRDEPDVRRWV